jgi:hypothetical protein
MPRRKNWIFAVMLASVLLLPVIVLAQAEDDARDIVLKAVQDVIALDGYHIKLKTSTLNTFTQKDGSVITVYAAQVVEGDVAGNGDRYFIRQIHKGDTFENAMKSAPLVVKQIVSGGETYVNFQTADTAYADILDFQPGWWVYDELLNSVDSDTTKFVIRGYGQSDTILEHFFRDDTVISAEELEPQMDNGVKLRVFNVELDALQLLVEQTAFSTDGQEQTLDQNTHLLDASDITLTFRLWIGTEDGLIYRGKGDLRTYIPYATAGNENTPAFDQDSNGTLEFMVSRHGEPVVITPPDPASLNE